MVPNLPDRLRLFIAHCAGNGRFLWVAWAVFCGFFSWSSIDFNSKIPLEDWRHDLRGDASGYYIYLPGTFHHGMRAADMSDSLRVVAGLGFTLDRENDRIITKYTCAPAILMLPFYLLAEAIEGWGVSDGWSRTHHQTIELGAVFYWSLGLMLLAGSLMRRLPTVPVVAILCVAAIAFGTNSFYYAFRAPAFSHVYSFFLVCLAIHAIYVDPGRPMRKGMRWLFLIACAMIVAVRPIDVVAALALVGLLGIERPGELRQPGFYPAGVLACALVAAPQLLFWKFAHGHWLVYSYGEEGFTNWASPYIKEVLMAPRNGLLPHAPALFLLPLGLWAQWRVDKRVALLLAATFAIILYSFAAWHSWDFGCSYGMRPFVQYTPFAALFTWPLLHMLHARWPPVFWSLAIVLVLVSFVNYRAMLEYDGCNLWPFWDWLPFGRNLWEAFFGRFPC
ncbi:MAG TPA: hypothetical protein PKY96_00340 [Flavobacteriales bacterium]|nr:hypothetical protein [Flavobacteriales bacterium]HRD51072.1 hypothetical protein [Flavobacteriales bacterium]